MTFPPWVTMLRSMRDVTRPKIPAAATCLLLCAGCVSPATHSALQTRFDATHAVAVEQTERVRLLEDLLKETRSRAAELEQKSRQLEAEVALLGEQVERLEAERNELREESQKLRQERLALRSSLSELTRHLKVLSDRKQAAEARAAEYREVLNRFESVIEALD